MSTARSSAASSPDEAGGMDMTATRWLLVLGCLYSAPLTAAAADVPVDLGNITERHEMVPMRDGKRLSVYLYFPPGMSLFHEGYGIGGTTRRERFKQMDAVCRAPADNRRLMDEWFRHPTSDAYWAAEDCTHHLDRMDVPCFTVGSWYDFMCVGSV